MTRSLIALALAFATSIAAAQSYPYEPAVVTLQGTLLSSPGETPDGVKLRFPSLRLSKPITVQNAPNDPGTEKGVVLMHMALNEKNMATFKRRRASRSRSSARSFMRTTATSRRTCWCRPCRSRR